MTMEVVNEINSVTSLHACKSYRTVELQNSAALYHFTSDQRNPFLPQVCEEDKIYWDTLSN